MTLRTCDSSVIHIAAICGTAVPTLDANKIAARSRVAKCLACLARRLSASASSCASGLTNTSGDAPPPPDRDASPIRRHRRVSGQTFREGPLAVLTYLRAGEAPE